MFSVGELGSSPRGLKALCERTQLETIFLELARSAKKNFFIAWCHAFARILTAKENVEEPEAVRKFVEKIPNTGVWVAEIITRNFKVFDEDNRYAIYHVFQGLAIHQFGLQILIDSPAKFFEFIIKRSNENSKIGTEWKYLVIKTITENKDAFRLIEGRTWIDLQTYVKRGPFYAESQAQVAFKEDF